MAKVPIKETDKSKSYFKYYEWEIKHLTADQLEEVSKSKGKVEDALEIDDRNKLLDMDYIPEKTGYYPLKAGGMLVSSTMKMPDVTGEMLNWWWPWHALDPLRYAIWNPEDHYDTKVPEEARARILNPDIPVAEKIWGCDNTVLESVGGPADDITIMFRNPLELGYDAEKASADTCEFLIAGNSLMGEMKIPVVMTETARKINGVMHFMARFWVGYHIIDGQAKYLLPPEVQLPEEVAIGLIGHNIKEFSHLNKLLPKVYAEEKDNWEVPNP